MGVPYWIKLVIFSAVVATTAAQFVDASTRAPTASTKAPTASTKAPTASTWQPIACDTTLQIGKPSRAKHHPGNKAIALFDCQNVQLY